MTTVRAFSADCFRSQGEQNPQVSRQVSFAKTLSVGATMAQTVFILFGLAFLNQAQSLKMGLPFLLSLK